MSKRIFNPTKQDVFVVIKGDRFSVDSESEVILDDANADAWKKVHKFLVVTPVAEKKTVVSELKEDTLVEEEKVEKKITKKTK